MKLVIQIFAYCFAKKLLPFKKRNQTHEGDDFKPKKKKKEERRNKTKTKKIKFQFQNIIFTKITLLTLSENYD